MRVLHNDQIVDRSQVHVDLEDRGYQFGDGIYEVVRIYNGKFFTLEEHLIRLERSARELRIELPVKIESLKRNLQELIALEQITDGIVYIQVNRGVAPRVHHFPTETSANLVAYASPLPRPLTTIRDGAKAILVEDIRWLRCDIKSVNLLGNVLAKQQAKEAGAQEAIQHRGDKVTEGSSTNVFVVREGTLYTHPSNNLILNGITRGVVLDIAKEIHVPVVEEALPVDFLLAADEVMITSTTQEITPIVEIDSKPVGDGKPGPITQKLQKGFEERLSLL